MQIIDASHQLGTGPFAGKVAEEDPQSPNTTTTSSSSPGTLQSPQHIHGEQYHGSHPARRSSQRNGSLGLETGVSVEQAETDFAELSRELSGVSQHSRQLSRTTSRRSNLSVKNAVVDVEKTATTSEESDAEQWDLEQTLRGSKEEEYAAGIKTKRIGVLWDDLTVSGVGGVRNFVKTFPDAFASFLNVPGTLMHLCGYGKKGREFDILRGFRGLVTPGEMVLVLGRPGSGCTTFLKVIGTSRTGFCSSLAETMLSGSSKSTIWIYQGWWRSALWPFRREDLREEVSW